MIHALWNAYTAGFLFFFTLLGAFTMFVVCVLVVMLIVHYVTDKARGIK